MQFIGSGQLVQIQCLQLPIHALKRPMQQVLICAWPELKTLSQSLTPMLIKCLGRMWCVDVKLAKCCKLKVLEPILYLGQVAKRS